MGLTRSYVGAKLQDVCRQQVDFEVDALFRVCFQNTVVLFEPKSWGKTIKDFYHLRKKNENIEHIGLIFETPNVFLYYSIEMIL